MAPAKHCSRQKSQTRSEKHEQTSNFHVAELSLQKFVCGSVSGESKKGCSSFRSSTIFSYQCLNQNTKVGRRDRPKLKDKKKTETAIEENSLYRCLFVALSVSNRR
jgi:hypothetical protein